MNISTRQLVIPLTLIFSAVTAWITYDLTRSSADDTFEALVDDGRIQLMQRIDSVTLALDGLAGFVNASDGVSQIQWSNYVDALDYQQNLPQVAGFGLIKPVDAADLSEFSASTRDDPTGGFTAYPQTPFQEKKVVRFIAPLEPYVSVLGLDFSVETFRRQAADTARDTGQIQMTGPVSLLGGKSNRSGFLILRPRYQTRMPLDTVEERRAAFLDWIFAPLVADTALAGMTANQGELYTLSIFDTASPNRAVFGETDRAPGAYEVIDTLPVLGRTWQVRWTSTPGFDASNGRSLFFFVVLGGVVITVLLSEYQLAISHRDRTKSRQLVSNEDRNRAIFDNAVFGMLVLDEKDYVLSANAAAFHLFETDDLQGARIRDLVDGPEMSDGWTFATATTQTATGSMIHLELQRNSWTNADGETRRTVILRDVTQAAKNAVALRQNEERWNLALKGADIGVFDVDLRTQTAVVSDTWLRLMRIDPDIPMEEARDAFMARLHPDDRPAVLKADRDCLTGRTARSISEFRVKFDDGTWRYMRSDAAVAERDGSGRAVRLVGAQTDIHVLRTMQNALHASEERLRLAQSHAPVGMAILDSDGTLTSPNAALAALTGQDVDTLARMQLSDLFAPDDSEEIVASVIDLQGEPDRTFRKEVRICHTEGDERWGMVKVSWAADPHGSDGEIFVMQINDITQEMEAQKLKSQFVATVSHELRTPLTSIKGALGLISKAADSPGAKFPTRLLDIAQANVDRLIYLVNDILDFEKSSSGRLEFRPSEQMAATLVRQTIEHNTPYADRFGVRLVVNDTTQGATVMADPDRLSQVLSNLLSNASKNAPEGTDVTVQIDRKRDDLRFSVVDHGPGVPKEFRDRIFQPFSQADSSDTRAKGGTGLGLNISRQIVEAMGGEIGFDSEPGLTKFWFTCPEANVKSDPVPTKLDTPQDVVPLAQVLCLESDHDFAKILSSNLQHLATVTTARTVDEARDLIGTRSFDMILVDWALSDTRSENLLDELLTAYPDAKFIALSATEHATTSPAIKERLAKSHKTIDDVARELRHLREGIAAE